jgi:HEPN domain-containing protein
MMPMSEALVAKAEMALNTAERELAVEVGPNFDAVCQHAEQCVERYLKARLMEEDIPFPEYTRHLVVLLELCLEQDPTWETFRSHLRTLTTLGFQAEITEHITGFEAAKESLELCREFRAAARQTLGL